jgi:hypothetical protein
MFRAEAHLYKVMVFRSTSSGKVWEEANASSWPSNRSLTNIPDEVVANEKRPKAWSLTIAHSMAMHLQTNIAAPATGILTSSGGPKLNKATQNMYRSLHQYLVEAQVLQNQF